MLYKNTSFVKIKNEKFITLYLKCWFLYLKKNNFIIGNVVKYFCMDFILMCVYMYVDSL